MPGFMRHAAIKGLKAALEALIKMVERRLLFIYNKKNSRSFDRLSFKE